MHSHLRHSSLLRRLIKRKVISEFDRDKYSVKCVTEIANGRYL